MKTIILIIVFFSSLLIFAKEPSSGQNVATVSENLTTTSFSFVRGHKLGKNTTVTWGMNNNTRISHFYIECTYEDPDDPYSVWQSVGVLPCTKSPVYKFLDSPVLPGTLNYRIVAVMNDNTSIKSPLYTTIIP